MKRYESNQEILRIIIMLVMKFIWWFIYGVNTSNTAVKLTHIVVNQRFKINDSKKWLERGNVKTRETYENEHAILGLTGDMWRCEFLNRFPGVQVPGCSTNLALARPLRLKSAGYCRYKNKTYHFYGLFRAVRLSQWTTNPFLLNTLKYY